MAFRQFLLGFLAFTIVIAAAVWFTLKRDDIPYSRLETAYGQENSIFLDLPGGLLGHVIDVGPRDAEHTLVLVHGLGDSVSTWSDWIHALQSDYRLVVIDLPGHGLTRAPYTYRASVDAAVALIETRSGETPHTAWYHSERQCKNGKEEGVVRLTARACVKEAESKSDRSR